MKRGPLLVFTCYAMWGVLPIYWKLLQSVDAYFILGNRIVWSFVFALLLVLNRHSLVKFKSALFDKKECLRLFLAGFVCVFNWGCYIIAINTDHIVDASLAYFLSPIISIVIGRMIFREHLAPMQWVAVGIATTGVAISVLSYGHLPWLALMIGASFAVYGALQKKMHTDGVVSLGVEMLFFTPLTVGLLFFAIGSGRAGSVELWQWWLLPTTGIITAVPLVMFSIGIVQTSYSLSGILMYINPTLQLLVGVFLYNEAVSRAEMVTFFFVWVALILYLISMVLQQNRHLYRKK